MLSADTIFSSLGRTRGLLVAVSGGPDSIALLALAADWSKGADRPPVFAATFDHMFREASRKEAEDCAALCARLGIPHSILEWQGDKPASRIQEAAREARYGALLDHARAIGADTLLTGHHADDQMETILFRLIRGSGIGGLAGMKTITRRGDILHVRPLLDCRKAELVAFCEARALAFVADPSNEDPRYARTGLRQLAPLLEEAGLGPGAFARLARRASRAEAALSAAAHDLREQACLARTERETRLDAHLLARAPEELVLRLVMDEIAARGRAPRLEQGEPLVEALLDSKRAGQAYRANLAGALIDLGQDGVIVIAPEPPRRG